MVASRRLYTRVCKIVYIVYTKKHKNVYSVYTKKHKIVYTTPLGLEQTMTIPTPRPLKRKFSERIEDWFHTDVTHPLLVMGARRTGKTYLINQMGRQLAGDQFVSLDFQTLACHCEWQSSWCYDASTQAAVSLWRSPGNAPPLGLRGVSLGHGRGRDGTCNSRARHVP